jgi:hypothetical protein
MDASALRAVLKVEETMKLRIIGGTDFRDAQRRVNDEQALEDMRRSPVQPAEPPERSLVDELVSEANFWERLALLCLSVALITATILLWLAWRISQ